MTWGTGTWGSGSPWGTGEALPPPTLISVSSEPGATASRSEPAVVARRGGTILRVIGTNFFDPVTVEILRGGAGAYEVVGEAYVFDPEFDVAPNRIICGAPAFGAPVASLGGDRPGDGLYHVRVTTDGGTTEVLEDTIEARLFAEENKTLAVRNKYSRQWVAGPRVLSGARPDIDI